MVEVVKEFPGGGVVVKGRRNVEVKLLHPAISEDDLKPKTPGSAGIDLVAATFYGDDASEELGFNLIQPGQVVMIGTGIAIHISDPGYAGMILPRSGLGNKGLVLGNLVGLIDSDYQGEIKVSAWNRSDEIIRVTRMDRIAQLILVPVLVPYFEVVSEFKASLRGDGGFGSTGVAS